MIIDHLYYIPESLYQGALAVANRTGERQVIGVAYGGAYNPRLTIQQNADRLPGRSQGGPVLPVDAARRRGSGVDGEDYGEAGDCEMRILLGCEESGVAREAWRSRGHEAWSNDLLPARDGSPFHLQMDVRDAIREKGPWDGIVLFTPCTHTCLSGNRFWAGTPEREEGMSFTREVWMLANVWSRRVALEQPMSMIGKVMGRPTQRVNLWWFGDPETKETWLWLNGFPKLGADKPTAIRHPTVHYESPGIRNGLTRSQRRQTLRPGFARAMAEQWGGLV